MEIAHAVSVSMSWGAAAGQIDSQRSNQFLTLTPPHNYKFIAACVIALGYRTVKASILREKFIDSY